MATIQPTKPLSVVTGAAGLVGANLVRLLLQQGEPVRAVVHRDRRALADLDVEIVQADLLDPASLRRAFQGATYVYHLAGFLSLRMDTYDTLAATNITGTRNVVKACLESGVKRLVHFSSIHSRQQQPFDQVLDERRPLITDPHAPPYERTKAAGEIEVLRGIQQGLDAVIILPTAIVGPYDYKPSYFGRAVQMLARGQIPALVRGGYDWVDVRDVADGAWRAAHIGTLRPTHQGSEQGVLHVSWRAKNQDSQQDTRSSMQNGVKLAAPGIHQPESQGNQQEESLVRSYILSGHWHSIVEVSRMVGRITGRNAPRWIVPLPLARMAEPLMARLATLNGSEPLYNQAMLTALNSNRHISHARALQDLGYQPRPFYETLQDTLNWFTQHPGEAT